MKVVPEKRRAH